MLVRLARFDLAFQYKIKKIYRMDKSNRKLKILYKIRFFSWKTLRYSLNLEKKKKKEEWTKTIAN